MTRALPALLAAVVLLVGAPGHARDAGFAVDTLAVETAGGLHAFDVEVARTRAQMAQGLMHRTVVPPGEGMLFLYRPPQRVRMWMKDTFVSLDMLFVAADGRIAAIAERTVPLSLESVGPDVDVAAVIEVVAGTVEDLGIMVGDLVLHPHFGTEPEE